MAAQALKVDNSLKVDTPKSASSNSSSKATRSKAVRKLSLDMIKDKAKGAPVAKFLYKYFQTTDISNDEIAEELGYKSHSNMSMVRTGAARLPLIKAPKLADLLQIRERYEFGMLVAENNDPDSVEALKKLGVVINKQERELLDIINQFVPKGDMRNFKKNLINALENGDLS